MCEAIIDGKRAGASVICGGSTSGPNESFVAPTVITGVKPDMRIVREEIFGPVLSTITFRTVDEAIEKANNTAYGLSAGIWTEKGSRILQVAAQLKAGVVWANTFNRFDPASPFGGYKESGIGRETHKVMLDHYQQTKNLLVSYSENKLGFF